MVKLTPHAVSVEQDDACNAGTQKKRDATHILASTSQGSSNALILKKGARLQHTPHTYTTGGYAHTNEPPINSQQPFSHGLNNEFNNIYK